MDSDPLQHSLSSHKLQLGLPEVDHTSPKLMGDYLARLRRVAQGSHYGMWDWDIGEQCLYLFGGFWGRLGQLQQLPEAKTNVLSLFELVHEEDRETLVLATKAVLDQACEFNQQVRLDCGDKGYLWVQIEGKATRDNSGRLSQVSGLVIDISRLKETETLLRESEARHARILSATSDGIWEWTGEQGGFHFSSRCWEHLGYSEHDDEMLDGRNRLEVWRDRIHPDDRKAFDSQMHGHLKRQGPFDIEYRIAGKSGEWRWIRARGQASWDEAGRAVRMSGTNMDITDLKEAEEKVLRAKEVAEKANRAKSEFLSGMSHELRTPLNAILGYTQLFSLEGNLTQAQQENIEEIQRAGEHLLQLISDVLDLSKIETGSLTLSVEPVLPMRIITECLRLLQPMVMNKQVRLWVTANGLEEVSVRADATRLKQALLNLLGNAIKYNHQGGEVELIITLPQEGRLRIEVRDSGPGIPEERQAEVFEPFNRLGAEGSTIEGTGVGLVITRRLINMMNGALSFYSEVGKGSRFWVELPLVESCFREETAMALTDLSSGEIALRVSEPKRVLYVEDNPSNIRLMEQIFEQFPMLTLLTAKEAFYGLYRARTERPDLVVLDINLPGMDGYEVLGVLKQDRSTRDIPVLALSANAMSHDLLRGEEAGFDEYLTKPLDVGQLIEAFNRFLTPPVTL